LWPHRHLIYLHWWWCKKLWNLYRTYFGLLLNNLFWLLLCMLRNSYLSSLRLSLHHHLLWFNLILRLLNKLILLLLYRPLIKRSLNHLWSHWLHHPRHLLKWVHAHIWIHHHLGKRCLLLIWLELLCVPIWLLRVIWLWCYLLVYGSRVQLSCFFFFLLLFFFIIFFFFFFLLFFVLLFLFFFLFFLFLFFIILLLIFLWFTLIFFFFLLLFFLFFLRCFTRRCFFCFWTPSSCSKCCLGTSCTGQSCGHSWCLRSASSCHHYGFFLELSNWVKLIWRRKHHRFNLGNIWLLHLHHRLRLHDILLIIIEQILELFKLLLTIKELGYKLRFILR